MDWLDSMFSGGATTAGGQNAEIRSPRIGELGYGTGTVPDFLTKAMGLVPAPLSALPRVAKNVYETGQPKIGREAVNAAKDTVLQALLGLGASKAVTSVTRAAASTPKVDPLLLYHGTTESVAPKILAQGEFKPLGDTLSGRNYMYSELGPDTMYFTRPNKESQWWNSPDAGASRAAEYSSFIESRLSPDTKLYPVTDIKGWESLAKKIGLKNGKELSNKIFVEYGTGSRGKVAFDSAMNIVNRIKKLGYDGLDIRIGDSLNPTAKELDAMIESGFPSGPQVAIFSHSKVKPVKAIDRKELEKVIK